jgi:hypothetical protein
MREGVQSSTISLESKIPNAVVLTSSAVGDISRVGLLEGNYSKNQAVVNTKERPLVEPSVKQVSSASFSGTPLTGDKFTLVVNGTEHTITAGTAPATTLTLQGMRDAMEIQSVNLLSELRRRAVLLPLQLQWFLQRVLSPKFLPSKP